MVFLRTPFNLSFVVRLLFFVSVFSFISTSVLAQKSTKEERKLFKKARKHLMNEKYIDAQNTYQNLLKLNGTDDVYNFETGLSYYFADFERTKSVDYFEKALSHSKEDTIPELYYYLGKAYHLNQQYDESKVALGKFTRYINKSKRSGQYLLKETNASIESSETAINLKESENTDTRIINAGEGVNSAEMEYAPVYREQDDVLLFTARRKSNKGRLAKDLLPYEDIYLAKKHEDGTWKLLEDKNEIKKYLPPNFNTKKHDAGIIYSADGMTLYTYKKDRLWISEYKNNEWSDLVELSDNINDSKMNVPSISISKDGNTIFFVATRKNGFGGKDIYRARKDANGDWSKPELLDESVNTPQDEDAPFLSLDGKTLYFSSTGHNSIGAYDVFKCTLDGSTIGKPVNMGFPINSPANDIYFSTNNDNTGGYFSSDRAGSLGGMDIFEFCYECPEDQKFEHNINGTIADENNKPIEEVQILSKNSTQEGVSMVENGQFNLKIKEPGKQSISVEASNYISQSVDVEIPENVLNSELAIILIKITRDNKNYQVMTVISKALNVNISDTIPVGDLLANQNNQTDGGDTTSTSNSTTKAYSEKFYFDYNAKEMNVNGDAYEQFISTIVDRSKEGKVKISIESSASKVPTSAYSSNHELANVRGNETKELLIKSIQTKANMDNISFEKITTKVSGPNYAGDYQNTDKYKKYQYVNIVVQ